MIRRNEPRIALSVGAALCVIAAAASHAQQPTPAEINEVLQTKLSVMTNNLDQAYLLLARQREAAAVQAKKIADWEGWAKAYFGAPKPPVTVEPGQK